MTYLFLVNDKYFGGECLIGPCTCEGRDELLQLWSGEVNDSVPFDDRWGFQPVDCHAD